MHCISTPSILFEKLRIKLGDRGLRLKWNTLGTFVTEQIPGTKPSPPSIWARIKRQQKIRINPKTSAFAESGSLLEPWLNYREAWARSSIHERYYDCEWDEYKDSMIERQQKNHLGLIRSRRTLGLDYSRFRRFILERAERRNRSCEARFCKRKYATKTSILRTLLGSTLRIYRIRIERGSLYFNSHHERTDEKIKQRVYSPKYCICIFKLKHPWRFLSFGILSAAHFIKKFISRINLWSSNNEPRRNKYYSKGVWIN